MSDLNTKIVISVEDKSKSGTESIKTNLNSLTNDISKIGTSVQASADKSTQHLQSIASGLNNLKTTILAVAGIDLGVGMVKNLVTIADTSQQTAAKIKMVTSSTEEYQRAQESLFNIAQQTRGDLTATSDLYVKVQKSIKDLGGSQEQALATTKAINTAIALSGGSAEGAAAGLYQFNQALASGVLRGDEFNSMMEQTPKLAEAIAQGLGISTGELRGWAEQGKLTTQVLIEAIQKSSAGLQAELDKMPISVSQATQMVSNAFNKYVSDANNATGATQTISQGIKFVADNFTEIANVVANAGAVYAAWWGTKVVQSSIASAEASAKNFAAKREEAAAAERSALAAAEEAAQQEKLLLVKQKAAASAVAKATEELREAEAMVAAATSASELALAEERLAAAKVRASEASLAHATATKEVTALQAAQAASAEKASGSVGMLSGALGIASKAVGALFAAFVVIDLAKMAYDWAQKFEGFRIVVLNIEEGVMKAKVAFDLLIGAITRSEADQKIKELSAEYDKLREKTTDAAIAQEAAEKTKQQALGGTTTSLKALYDAQDSVNQKVAQAKEEADKAAAGAKAMEEAYKAGKVTQEQYNAALEVSAQANKKLEEAHQAQATAATSVRDRLNDLKKAHDDAKTAAAELEAKQKSGNATFDQVKAAYDKVISTQTQYKAALGEVIAKVESQQKVLESEAQIQESSSKVKQDAIKAERDDALARGDTKRAIELSSQALKEEIAQAYRSVDAKQQQAKAAKELASLTEEQAQADGKLDDAEKEAIASTQASAAAKEEASNAAKLYADSLTEIPDSLSQVAQEHQVTASEVQNFKTSAEEAIQVVNQMKEAHDQGKVSTADYAAASADAKTKVEGYKTAVQSLVAAKDLEVQSASRETTAIKTVYSARISELKSLQDSAKARGDLRGAAEIGVQISRLEAQQNLAVAQSIESEIRVMQAKLAAKQAELQADGLLSSADQEILAAAQDAIEAKRLEAETLRYAAQAKIDDADAALRNANATSDMADASSDMSRNADKTTESMNSLNIAAAKLNGTLIVAFGEGGIIRYNQALETLKGKVAEADLLMQKMGDSSGKTVQNMTESANKAESMAKYLENSAINGVDTAGTAKRLVEAAQQAREEAQKMREEFAKGVIEANQELSQKTAESRDKAVQALKDVGDSAASAIEKANQALEKSIASIDKALQLSNLSLDEKINAIERGTMTAEAAYADVLSSIQEKKQQIQDALSKGNVDTAKALTSQLESLAGNLKGVKSSSDSVSSSLSSASSAVKEIADAEEKFSKSAGDAQYKLADAIGTASDKATEEVAKVSESYTQAIKTAGEELKQSLLSIEQRLEQSNRTIDDRIAAIRRSEMSGMAAYKDTLASIEKTKSEIEAAIAAGDIARAEFLSGSLDSLVGSLNEVKDASGNVLVSQEQANSDTIKSLEDLKRINSELAEAQKKQAETDHQEKLSRIEAEKSANLKAIDDAKNADIKAAQDVFDKTMADLEAEKTQALNDAKGIQDTKMANIAQEYEAKAQAFYGGVTYSSAASGGGVSASKAANDAIGVLRDVKNINASIAELQKKQAQEDHDKAITDIDIEKATKVKAIEDVKKLEIDAANQVHNLKIKQLQEQYGLVAKILNEQAKAAEQNKGKWGNTIQQRSTGGHIPGYGGGDTVPAMLEQGEFVVRKEAVRALGLDALETINQGKVPIKRATGGLVTMDEYVDRYTSLEQAPKNPMVTASNQPGGGLLSIMIQKSEILGLIQSELKKQGIEASMIDVARYIREYAQSKKKESEASSVIADSTKKIADLSLREVTAKTTQAVQNDSISKSLVSLSQDTQSKAQALSQEARIPGYLKAMEEATAATKTMAQVSTVQGDALKNSLQSTLDSIAEAENRDAAIARAGEESLRLENLKTELNDAISNTKKAQLEQSKASTIAEALSAKATVDESLIAQAKAEAAIANFNASKASDEALQAKAAIKNATSESELKALTEAYNKAKAVANAKATEATTAQSKMTEAQRNLQVTKAKFQEMEDQDAAIANAKKKELDAAEEKANALKVVISSALGRIKQGEEADNKRQQLISEQDTYQSLIAQHTKAKESVEKASAELSKARTFEEKRSAALASEEAKLGVFRVELLLANLEETKARTQAESLKNSIATATSEQEVATLTAQYNSAAQLLRAKQEETRRAEARVEASQQSLESSRDYYDEQSKLQNEITNSTKEHASAQASIASMATQEASAKDTVLQAAKDAALKALTASDEAETKEAKAKDAKAKEAELQASIASARTNLDREKASLELKQFNLALVRAQQAEVKDALSKAQTVEEVARRKKEYEDLVTKANAISAEIDKSAALVKAMTTNQEFETRQRLKKEEAQSKAKEAASLSSGGAQTPAPKSVQPDTTPSATGGKPQSISQYDLSLNRGAGSSLGRLISDTAFSQFKNISALKFNLGGMLDTPQFDLSSMSPDISGVISSKGKGGTTGTSAPVKTVKVKFEGNNGASVTGVFGDNDVSSMLNILKTAGARVS